MNILFVTRNFNKSGFTILEKLIKDGFNISGVVLKQGKSPFNYPVLNSVLFRLYKLKCSYYRCLPVKTTQSEYLLARKNKIKTIVVSSIKGSEFKRQLIEINPDIIVVGGGWHELIPEYIFSFPKFGSINVHPSLLPEFRGTSITRWQVLNGVDTSGCTIHYINEKFDEGEIISQQSIEVSSDTTPQDLFKKLSELGADMMSQLLASIQKSGLPKTYINTGNNGKYDQYFSKWKWRDIDMKIDWSLSFRDIHFMILSNTQESYHFPGPYFIHDSVKVIIRITRLHHLQKFKKLIKYHLIDDEIRVLEILNNTYYLYRKNEEYVLEIVQIQKSDNYMKFRRGRSPHRILNLRKGEIFTKR